MVDPRVPSAIQAERRPSPGGAGLRLGAVGPPAQARGRRVSRFWSDRSETLALIAIPVGWIVRGRFQGVMAALDAAIHENTVAFI